MPIYNLQFPGGDTRLAKSAHLPRTGELVSYPGVLAQVTEVLHLAQDPDTEPTAVPIVAIAILRTED